jgi:hypothetical protein
MAPFPGSGEIGVNDSVILMHLCKEVLIYFAVVRLLAVDGGLPQSRDMESRISK